MKLPVRNEIDSIHSRTASSTPSHKERHEQQHQISNHKSAILEAQREQTGLCALI